MTDYPPPIPMGESPVPQYPAGSAMPPSIPAMPPPADLPPDLSSRQATQQTRTYPCAQCGNNLVFDPKPMCLVCPGCGSTRAVMVKDGPILKHDLASMQPSTVVDDLSKEIVCQSCGGHSTFNGSVTAIKCPYCATPIQRDDLQTSPARIPIDGIIPFGVDKGGAKEALTNWIGSRWFAPNAFKKFNEIGAFSSVYLSYWSYDADTVTEYRGQCGITRTRVVGEGDNQRTETYTEWYPTFGTVEDNIRDLSVLANSGLDLNHVTELEPWPMESAANYSPDFVAGHLARTYDSDAQQTFDAVGSDRVENIVSATVRADIGGDRQIIDWMNVQYRFLNYAQLLLPVWLMTVIFNGRTFQVFVNGITGEVQGERPYSPVKIAIAVIVTVIIVALLFYLYSRYGG